MHKERLTKEEKFAAYLPYGVYFGVGKEVYELTGVSFCSPKRLIASYSPFGGRPLINYFNLDGAREFSCKINGAHLFLRPIEDCMRTFTHKGASVSLFKDLGARLYDELAELYFNMENNKKAAGKISERLRSILLYYHFDIYGMLGVYAKHTSLVDEYFRRNKLTF